MKFVRYIKHALIPCLVISGLLVTSCVDDDGMNIETPNGPPSINYIRVTNPDASDSLIVEATLGSTVVIMGSNLGGTREVWFNDQQAMINPTWVTNQNIFVSVPQNAPVQITDRLYLINDKKDTLAYPFIVAIPPPELYSARNEWPQEGELLIINGDYFFDVVPVIVKFTGGVEAEATVLSQSQLQVEVPDGATEGPVTVITNFGQETSTFHLWDKRNIVLNFDDLVANGWRIGLHENTDGPIDNNYAVFRGDINANQRDEGPGAPGRSPLLFEYWGGNDASRTENFYPLYPNSYRDYVLKFEAKVNNWYGGFLNLCLSTPEHTGNNQEIWSNTYNARAIWGPWSQTGEEFTTNGQWITVVIPMTDFHYFMGTDATGVVYTPNQKFIETAAGSFSAWLLGSPQNTGNAVEFYIDNIRFVQP
jgi:hypothetical protein